MSLRIDTAELISGAYVVGETGLGVLAENIPSSGLDGASFLYNDLSLPADNGKEIRGLIVTPPASGTFFAWEDGSFTLVGAADGSYTFVYRLYVDGVDQGTATATITVGAVVSSTLSGSATLGDIIASGGFSVVPPASLDLILKILRNRQELNPNTGKFTLYDDDGATVLMQSNAWADVGGTQPYSGGTLARIDALI